MSGIVLDAGGLIAVDRNERAVLLLLAEALAAGSSVTVPASALAQVIRRPARRPRLSRLSDLRRLDPALEIYRV